MSNKYIDFLYLAKAKGYEAAAKAVYGRGTFDTPKDLAIFLRSIGLGLGNIAAICQLRFGYGCSSSVARWTDPSVDERFNAYRRSLRTKVSFAAVKKYARNLHTRGFPKCEILKRCQKRYGQGCKSSIGRWLRK